MESRISAKEALDNIGKAIENFLPENQDNPNKRELMHLNRIIDSINEALIECGDLSIGVGDALQTARDNLAEERQNTFGDLVDWDEIARRIE